MTTIKSLSLAQTAILSKYHRKSILGDLQSQLDSLGNYKALMMRKLIDYMTTPSGNEYTDLVNQLYLDKDIDWDRVIDDILLAVAESARIDLSQIVSRIVHMFGDSSVDSMPIQVNIASNAVLAMGGICYRNQRGGDVSKYVGVTSLMHVSPDIMRRLAVCESKPPILQTPDDIVGHTCANGNDYSVMLGSSLNLPKDMSTVNLPIDDLNMATSVPLAVSPIANILPIEMTSKQKAIEDQYAATLGHIKYTMAVKDIMQDVDANGGRFYIQAVLDYRGRQYSSCSALSYQGNKSVKPLVHLYHKQAITSDGLQWLKIHVANCYELDKLPLVERLAWVDDNITNLLEVEGETCYLDAANELTKVLAGEHTGIRVGIDFTNSGYQIIALLTGCLKTAFSTNLLGGDRKDLYTQCMDLFNGATGTTYNRKEFKEIMVPVAYGSTSSVKALPKQQQKVFWKVLETCAPGFMQYRDMLIGLWNPEALSYTIRSFDGYTFSFPVLDTLETTVTLTAFENRSMTFRYKANTTMEKSVKLVANCTHLADAGVIREIRARSRYDMVEASASLAVLKTMPSEAAKGYCETFVTYRDAIAMVNPTKERVSDMIRILEDCIEHEPFDIVTEFDDITSHANNVGFVHSHATRIYAQMADANILEEMIRDITMNTSMEYSKLSKNLGSSVYENAVYHIT